MPSFLWAPIASFSQARLGLRTQVCVDKFNTSNSTKTLCSYISWVCIHKVLLLMIPILHKSRTRKERKEIGKAGVAKPATKLLLQGELVIG